jgi:hypothetical protein
VTTYNCGGGDPEQLDLHEMMQVQQGSTTIYNLRGGVEGVENRFSGGGVEVLRAA